jgi:hypothetical protein
MRPKLRIATTTVVIAVVVAALAVQAAAEVAQKGGVRVVVSGEMSPNRLPRDGTAAIAVSLAGRISAARREVLPQLTEISISINRHGRLDLRGLPVCRLGRIDPSTTQQALAACRPSLVGKGSFSADVRIPDQSPFPSQGKLVAFNGKLNGKPALFAHIYGTEPVPTSYVLPFSIQTMAAGVYGTTLRAALPRVTGEWGYVTGISLRLDGTHSARGESHGYLAASCPAPRGFGSIVFPLARTTFSFQSGVSLTSTLIRSCKVR